MQNQTLVIDNIISTDGHYSKVFLGQSTFDAIRTKGINKEYTNMGWTAPVNGDLVRVYDLNGVEITALWNPKTKSSFYVRKEVAEANYKPVSKQVASLPFNPASFARIVASV